MYFRFKPKYIELDYLLAKYSDKNLNFFFDFKNGVFQKEELINENLHLSVSELIVTTMNVIPYIKNKLRTDGFKNEIRFFFFTEVGKSYYHKALNIEYKRNRELNDFLFRTEENDVFSRMIFFSVDILEKTINYLPKCYFFKGEYLEYDFIPYAIAKTFFEKEKDVGIIFSNDKDMYQMQLFEEYIFEQYEKLYMKGESNWHSGRLFINRDNFIERFCASLGVESIANEDKKFIRDYFVLIRAILGDEGDNIEGVKNIGLKTILKNKEFFINTFRKNNELREVIKELKFSDYDSELAKKIFLKFDIEKVKSKRFKQLFEEANIERICRNIALMDFDIIWEKIRSNFKEHIESVLKNDKKVENKEQLMALISSLNQMLIYKISEQVELFFL